MSTEFDTGFALVAPVYKVHTAALNEMIKTVPNCSGATFHEDGPGMYRVIAENLGPMGTGTPDDLLAAQTVLDAHDPVFLSASKLAIRADDLDEVTVTVTALKPDAAPVVLLVSINGGAASEWAISLVDGVGSDVITAADPCSITITLKDPDNRSTDALTLIAR
jgi:hypothetical protein